jgi:hypothetical protein
MTLSNTFRTSFFCLVFGLILFGCSEKKPFSLDKDDIRFAGFYSDYLLVSGVSSGNDNAVPNAVDSSELNQLLERNALTPETLKRKTQIYKENSELWKAVLVQVRENIRKKSAAAQ